MPLSRNDLAATIGIIVLTSVIMIGAAAGLLQTSEVSSAVAFVLVAGIATCAGIILTPRLRKEENKKPNENNQSLEYTRNRESHGAYLNLSALIEKIRDPNYLRADFHDLSIVVPPGSLHILQADFEAIGQITRPENPDIEPHTCDAWRKVRALGTYYYPSGIRVVEVNSQAFGDFEEDVKRTIDRLVQTLRNRG